MNKREWEVKSTLVKRVTVRHRVFAESKGVATELVMLGKGERIGRLAQWIRQSQPTCLDQNRRAANHSAVRASSIGPPAPIGIKLAQ